jgi:hypothetical protein
MYGGGNTPPIVGNSILAGNTGPDVSSSFTSAGYNLIGKGSEATGFTALGDQVGTTNSPLYPDLSSLGFHGGSTPTMPPFYNSLAVDQGKSFGLTTDQRGRVRTFDDPTVFNATLGDGTDIGAVEARPGYVVELVVTNSNDSGPGSLRQALLQASSFEYDVITFATHVTNTIRLTSGELVVNKPLGIQGPGLESLWGPSARKLIISGNNTSRVFRLTYGGSTLSGLTIADGVANEGAGILVQLGNHFIQACQIVSNSASIRGGGIQVETNAILSLYNSSVTDNQAVIGGGGIVHNGAATTALGSSTIARNRTTLPFEGIISPQGGGIWVPAGLFQVVNSTIASNTSTYAGGGICNGLFSTGSVQIVNSIIAGNSAVGAGPDVVGAVTSQGFNLIGNTSGSSGFGATTDQLNVNPLLGPLGDFGGASLTMALRAGSPAIDKGYASGWYSDQREFIRPLDDPSIPNAVGGDGADIGAYEVDPRLRILEFSTVGSDVALGLMTVLGRNYRVDFTNHLGPGPWTTFTNNAPGNGHLLWVTNYGGAGQGQRFYRAAIVP